MTHVAAALAAVSVGQPKTAGRLTMFPLLKQAPAPPKYLLLDEALAGGVARVTETSVSGSVPELKFENHSDQPILIVDGEALIGAKQNRIVNISILAPAQSVTPIPVSCVERGRWAYRRPDFGSGDHVLYSRSRAQKAHHVSASLRASGKPRADQSAIWNDIALKSRRMASQSKSEAMDAMYSKVHHDLASVDSRLIPAVNQVGAVFALDGHLVGLELFDAVETWRRFAHKVHRSYGLDALDPAAHIHSVATDVHKWLQLVASAPVAQFPSVGLGRDARFGDATVSGGALVFGEAVIHCVAFDASAWQQQGQ
jgi:hypothetical protein